MTTVVVKHPLALPGCDNNVACVIKSCLFLESVDVRNKTHWFLIILECDGWRVFGRESTPPPPFGQGVTPPLGREWPPLGQSSVYREPQGQTVRLSDSKRVGEAIPQYDSQIANRREWRWEKVQKCTVLLYELDGVASLLADPPQLNSNTRKNQPDLPDIRTFEKIMLFYLFGI